MKKLRYLAGLLSVALLSTLLVIPAAALEKLPTPVSVEWLTQDKQIVVQGDNGTETFYFPKDQLLISGVPRCQPDIYLVVKHQETGAIIEESRWSAGGRWRNGYRSLPFGLDHPDPLPTGNYIVSAYFTGDGQKYADGDVFTSQPFYFTDPGVQYETPTNVCWKDNKPSFDFKEGPDGSGNYPFGINIQYYFGDEYIGSSSQTPYHDGWASEFMSDFRKYTVNSMGSGNYSFQVRFLSQNRAVKQHGGWSQLSEPLFISADSQDIAGGLDQIQNDLAGGTPTTEQKWGALDALQSMNQEELKNAIAADRDGSGVNGQLQQLEASMGLSATVEKDPHSTVDVDPALVSIVGAGLNTSDVDQAPQLTISDPPADLIIPDAYTSTLQVDLSLSGANTAPDGSLAIPVRITLPVPAGMDPNKLRVLHFRQDIGQTELLFPYCFEGTPGQQMATFLVDHLSPFALVSAEDLEVLWQGPNAVLANHGSDPLQVKLLVAGYREGRFIGCAAAEGEVAANGGELALNIASLQTADQLRAFVLDSTTNAPLIAPQEKF